jgi:hypothetical protein
VSAVVVQVPAPFPGAPLCWRVGVGDLWGIPGQQLAAPSGPAVITLELKVATAGLWLQATTRFQVLVAPEGTTRVVLRALAGSRTAARDR